MAGDEFEEGVKKVVFFSFLLGGFRSRHLVLLMLVLVHGREKTTLIAVFFLFFFYFLVFGIY